MYIYIYIYNIYYVIFQTKRSKYRSKNWKSFSIYVTKEKKKGNYSFIHTVTFKLLFFSYYVHVIKELFIFHLSFSHTSCIYIYIFIKHGEFSLKRNNAKLKKRKRIHNILRPLSFDYQIPRRNFFFHPYKILTICNTKYSHRPLFFSNYQIPHKILPSLISNYINFRLLVVIIIIIKYCWSWSKVRHRW